MIWTVVTFCSQTDRLTNIRNPKASLRKITTTSLNWISSTTGPTNTSTTTRKAETKHSSDGIAWTFATQPINNDAVSDNLAIEVREYVVHEDVDSKKNASEVETTPTSRKPPSNGSYQVHLIASSNYRNWNNGGNIPMRTAYWVANPLDWRRQQQYGYHWVHWEQRPGKD